MLPKDQERFCFTTYTSFRLQFETYVDLNNTSISSAVLSTNRPANQIVKMIMMALFLLIVFISEAITAIQNPVCPSRHWVTVLDGYYLSLAI